MKSLSLFSQFFGIAALGFALVPSSAAQAGGANLHFTISTTQAWTDTGVDLRAGDLLQITAGQPREGNACNPAGDGAPAQGLPVADAPAGALIARVEAKATPTLVGNSLEMHINDPGHLSLGINAEGAPPCNGSFAVTVHIVPGADSAATSAAASTAPSATAITAPPATANSAAAATQPAGSNAAASKASTSMAPATPAAKLASAAQIWLNGQFGKPGGTAAPATSTSAAVGSSPSTTSNSATAPNTVTPVVTVSPGSLDPVLTKQIDGLPRRVNDEFDNLGDMVNFVIVGSEQQVQGALESANWHVADKDVKEAALKAILQTYQKKDYLQMPMSQLKLFGRNQDFGYEQAEPYAVVASRHHFRIWKAPFTYNGQEVWVGAGTHDIGFEKDQRNGKVTHKIDPAVDGERDNIGMSLQKTGKVKSLHYYLPPEPVQDAKNATGGGYHSDGRILVIQVQ